MESVFIITGAAGGAAGAIARVFHDAGARLALVDRSSDDLGELAAAVGGLALGADLRDPGEAAAVVAETKRAFGRVDGLIHAVGGFAMAAAAESDAALYQRMFEMNVRTLLVTVHALLPSLLERKTGFIAGFSAGPVVSPGGAARMSVYVAAKAAVAAYLRSLSLELESDGIRTAVVFPLAAIDTAGNRTAMPQADPAGWIDPVAIGEALLFAASRGPRGVISELRVGVLDARSGQRL